MSIADDIDLIRVSLLDNTLPDKVIQLVEKEIVYFLYELNPTASVNKKINYLCYYSTHTIANHMGPISWSYISGISKDNIIYYFKNRCRLSGISNSSFIRDLQDIYLQVVTGMIFDKALYKENITESTDYNARLLYLFDLIFVKMPQVDKFTIDSGCNLIEFADFISKIDISIFSSILTYLKHLELIKNKDIPPLLKFFYINNNLHRDNTN